MKVIGPTRLGYLWSNIKSYIAGKKYAGGATDGGTANKAASIPFGEVDSTSTATAFTATVDGITELRDGVSLYLKNTVVSSAAASTAPKCWTLNINNLGAKPVYVTTAAATYSTTQFTVNYKFLFTYDSSLNSENGGWYIGILYNTNTTYSTITQAEIDAGTGTKARNITPKLLRDNFYTEGEVDTLLNSKVDNYSLEMEIGISGSSYSVESIAYNNTYVTTFSAIYDICVSGSTSIVIKGYIDDGTDTNYYFYYVGSNMLGSGDVYFVSPQEEGYFVLHLYSEGSDVLYSSIDYVEYAQGGSGDVNVIEGITMNGSAITPDANKVVNLGTVITAHQDISGKQDVISDLAAIRSGAALGATALQSYTETDPTVPAWAKAANKPSYTAAEVGALPDSTTIPSASTATPEMDGTGAAGSASTYAKGDHVHPTDTSREARVTTVSHGTSDTTFALTPNVLHTWGTINSLTLTLASGSSTYVDGYWFKFTAGSSFSALTLPTGVVWAAEPEIEAGKTYEVFIVNNLATYITEGIENMYATKQWVQNNIHIPVTSIVAASGSSLSAQVNTIYTYSSAITSLAITLPSVGDVTKAEAISFILTTGTSPTISFSSANSIPILYHDGYRIEGDTIYELNAMFVGSSWIIGMCKIETS